MDGICFDISKFVAIDLSTCVASNRLYLRDHCISVEFSCRDSDLAVVHEVSCRFETFGDAFGRVPEVLACCCFNCSLCHLQSTFPQLGQVFRGQAILWLAQIDRENGSIRVLEEPAIDVVINKRL